MPLSPTDIKVTIMKRGDTLAGLARRWNTTRDVLSRIVHRHDGYAYPVERQKLAKYLGVPVAQIGREVARKPKKKAA
jgi:lambda repressor-like predicted transcriptional regulator